MENKPINDTNTNNHEAPTTLPPIGGPVDYSLAAKETAPLPVLQQNIPEQTMAKPIEGLAKESTPPTLRWRIGALLRGMRSVAGEVLIENSKHALSEHPMTRTGSNHSGSGNAAPDHYTQ